MKSRFLFLGLSIWTLALNSCTDQLALEKVNKPTDQKLESASSATAALSAMTVSAPTVIATTAQLNNMSMTYIDIGLPTYWDGVERIWLHSENGGATHQRFTGLAGAPCTQLRWEKTRGQVFTNNYNITGQPWIANVYKDSQGVLAFLHIEHDGSNKRKNRVALAWSTDNSNSFKYLGYIITPYGDTDDLNIEGVPYFIKDGYFYIYFKEGTGTDYRKIAVARARVTDVIAAAKAGTVTQWKKYRNGAWNENGLGGNYTPLAPDRITHTNAFHSSYNNKYYLTITNMTWGGVNTYVKLWESTDGINFTLSRTIVEKTAAEVGVNTGYQYSNVIDAGGGKPHTEVGQTFYLYCGYKPYSATEKQLHRWTITL
jgi:hypothetical protein